MLHEVNLRFERMRLRCRIARDARVENKKGFESTMRPVDEVGRMVHGGRVTIGQRRGRVREEAQT